MGKSAFSNPPLPWLRNADLSLAELAEEYARLAREEARYWAEMDRHNEIGYGDVFERVVDRCRDRTAIIEVESHRSYTFSELDMAADKVACWVRRHFHANKVGVYHKNGFAFLAAVLGLAKAGKPAVLFNQSETPRGVLRLAKRYGIRHILGDVADIPHRKISSLLEQDWPGRAPKSWRRSVNQEDPVAIIFTSGASGVAKPALFSHRRMIGAGIAWSLRTYMTERERCYITLPLCHGNALAVAFSACLMAGASAVIRNSFSARNFLPDIRRFQCTSMVYIGELWRYLLSSAPRLDDADHPLRTIFGNGLDASLWEPVTTRFGITHVVEHFGATEMPAGALTNWTGRPGYCGFIPPDHPESRDVLIVDESGREVIRGAAGEALFNIPGNRYRGYLDPLYDEDKVWRNLRTPSDTWWRSGDLLRKTDDGFFTFVERMGDSFRWKGENVSSVEVESVIRETGWFEEVVVYGVPAPHHAGKVGMASLLPNIEFGPTRLEALLAFLKRELPPFAIPHFLRVISKPHATTSTLKIKKADLAREGFSGIDTFPHYVLCAGEYSPLTKTVLEQLQERDFPLGFRENQIIFQFRDDSKHEEKTVRLDTP
uniref:Fatty-acyl-CoA synthase n=1 Tax=Candidatus Kentrum sp. MB TaxID=2138164 RepID=A0A450X9S4_9GAMM|nr:MAG: fatty-acyl-CoA synthase [Candidatus Kentron sp. MB]